MRPPSFKEELISQIPALQLLMAMGWTYIPPKEALRLRHYREGNVLLEEVLTDWLRRHNHIQYQGETYDFSESNLQNAVQALKDVPLYKGLIPANEEVYELLTLGKSFEQAIQGDKRSYSLNYIDWQHPENNVYHVTDEYSVEKLTTHETRRPDIVLFVNGIPLVVIECKRPDLEAKDGKAVEEAVSQMIRNQRSDEIPHLFLYSQLLFAISKNDAKYATTATAAKFWANWKEEGDIEAEVHPLINRPVSQDEKDLLYNHRDGARWVRAYFDDLEAAGERLPTEQDRTLYSLLRPSRLLELIYQFLVYDGGVKKIARYQQYFAIKATIARVAHLNAQGTRTGGVIWHTTGSGKSLTMVMLAKALALHPNIKNPRVVLVTDRVDLDDQIWRTFRACGKKAVKAGSGTHLLELVQSEKVDIITTVIDKFESVSRQKVKDHNPDVFMLVDEGHRGQYGTNHARMKQVFDQACYIGFTGTPLLKQDKATAAKFGGFIHTYTMRQAVEDEAVVPLLYEGRIVDLDVNRAALDDWFEKRTRKLSVAQKTDLKRKMSRAEEVSRADQRISAIAVDIAIHFEDNLRETGFKAQLACASKEVAIKYLRYLEEEGIQAAVIISSPDTREGNTEVDEEELPIVQAFWQKMMRQYGSEEAYNREIKASFAREDGIEILIVVDKLLVGFDEPRNTVLYVDKALKEHGLLQAIARVNRLFEGKDFGYIIDYRGVLGELNEALQTYNALEGYDPQDVEGAVTDVGVVIDALPQLHAQLWDVFKGVENQQDSESMERFLEPEDRRQAFYDALNEFARALKVAFSTADFYETTPESRLTVYKRDLQTFHNLRSAVRQRYAEAVDYKDYEQKIRKLIDTHLQASGVSQLTQLVNIFDKEAFDREVARLESPRAKADTIAYRLKRTITEKMDEDPAFYRKFSQLIDETIEAYRQRRLSELEYLHTMADALEQIRSGQDRALPTKLDGYRHAAAYYGIILEPLTQHASDPQSPSFLNFAADVAIRLEVVIEEQKIRDWIYNPNVQDDMRNAVEDYLYEIKSQHGIPLTSIEMDLIIDQLIEVARKRERL